MTYIKMRMISKLKNYIGGQACVNLCKLCKLVFTPKSDLTWSFQECGARDKHIKLSMSQSGFGKTLLNHRDFGVCTWRNKVYTWPFLVCIGQILVYTLFAHHADRRSKAVILSVNCAIHNVCDVPDALNYNLPQNFRSWTTKFIPSLHKVWLRFKLHQKIKFTKGLHSALTLSVYIVCS